MARQSSLIALSLLAHGALALGLGAIRPEQTRAATAIELAEIPKKKAAPPEEPPAAPPPPPSEPPKPARRALNRPAATPPPAAPPPAAEAPTPASTPASALPDFGLTLSGGVTGGGGIALPAAGPARAPTSPAVNPRPKVLANAVRPSDGCDEVASKPKPRNVVQPSYPDSARAAGVEGRVRVELTVDETGKVVAVRVLSGLGHGLDEAAVAAAKQSTFEPALRCGKPVRATFTISMRFRAS